MVLAARNEADAIVPTLERVAGLTYPGPIEVVLADNGSTDRTGELGDEAAKRLGFALIEKTKVLGSFPLCGQVVPEFGDPLIRELILKPYRIIYRVDEKAKVIGVARYWHGARSEPRFGDVR